MKKKYEDLKKVVLAEYEKDNVVFSDHDGMKVVKIDDFINQNVDGLLYDLNRDEAVVLTFIDNPKWVNDYAVAKVIRALKDKIDKLEKQLKQLENE